MTSVSCKTKENNGPQFSPPLFRQRYKMMTELVSRYSRGTFAKVVDMGCSSFGLFSYLKNIKGVREIVFLDIDYNLLKCHCCKIDPFSSDFLHKRNTPLAVSILCADARFIHASLKNSDVVLMVEFIEHVEENDLSSIVRSVFSGIMPKLIILTTPNRDFNKFFPDMEKGSFRHFDHKFEFSHSEFVSWCKSVISKYPNYQVRYTGCGGPIEGSYCTQIAIFLRNKFFTKTLVSQFQDPIPDNRYNTMSADIRPCHVNCISKESCNIIHSVEYPYDKRTPDELRSDAIKKSWFNFRLCLKFCFDKIAEAQCNTPAASDLNSDSETCSSKEVSSETTLKEDIITYLKNDLLIIRVNKEPLKSKKDKKTTTQDSTKTDKIFVKLITDIQSFTKEMISHQGIILYLDECKESFYFPLKTFRIWSGLNIKESLIAKTFNDMRVKKIKMEEHVFYVICLWNESDEETHSSDGIL